MNDTDRQLRPCLAELLRTCIKPSSLVLQVHHLVTQETTTDSASTSDLAVLPPPKIVPRFYLTDGELCIQALLQPALLADCGLSVGDLIEVRDFAVRKARRLNRNDKVVYLGIQDLEILSRHESADWGDEGGFIRSEEKNEQSTPPPKRRRIASREPSSEPRNSIPQPASMGKVPVRRSQTADNVTDNESNSDDGFESLDVDLHTIQERRQTLHNLQQTAAIPRPDCDENDTQETPRHVTPPPPPPTTFSSHHKSRSLTPPYHTLSALLSPTLPHKNYPLTTIAIITYVSPSLLSKPNSPFPPKRNIRLLDPSLPKSHTQGLTLAVYVDAKTFFPTAGTIALFRGVVMHKFGKEVILNAYAPLKDKPESEKWYVDDEVTLVEMGFDVEGLRAWWEDRVDRNGKT